MLRRSLRLVVYLGVLAFGAFNVGARRSNRNRRIPGQERLKTMRHGPNR